MRSVVALLLLLVSAVARGGATGEDVRRMEVELGVATWTADPEWFEENLAYEYILITPTGAARSKRDIIRELATPGMKMEPYEPTDLVVRLYGDSAVVTGRILQRFTLGNARYANDVRYTNIYVRRKSRWLLVSAHASNVAVRR